MAGRRRTAEPESQHVSRSPGPATQRQRDTRPQRRRAALQRDLARAGDEVAELTAAYEYVRSALRRCGTSPEVNRLVTELRDRLIETGDTVLTQNARKENHS